MTDQPMTFASIAKDTDTLTTFALDKVFQGTGKAEPVLSGACSAIARFTLLNEPPGTQAQQVLEKIAPLVRNVAQQMVNMRDGTGTTAPPIPPAKQHVVGYEALTAVLAEMPVPTFTILQDSLLFLVSVELANGKARSHATLIAPSDAKGQPRETAFAHLAAAQAAWGDPEEIIQNAIAGIIGDLNGDDQVAVLLDTLARVIVANSGDAATAHAVAASCAPDLLEGVENVIATGHDGSETIQ